MTKLVKKRPAAKRAKRVTWAMCHALSERAGVSVTAMLKPRSTFGQFFTIEGFAKPRSQQDALRALHAALLVLAEGRK